MPYSSYYAPQRLEELLDILAEKKETAKVLAGGTDYVVAMREGKLNCEDIVALHKVPELKGIRLQGDTIVVGAMTTHTELAKSPLIIERASLLAQAASAVGSPQIRNAGTVGGNIVNASPAADTVPALVALDARVKIVSKSGVREMPVEEVFLGMGKTKLAADEIIQEISFPALSKNAGSTFIKLARRNALAISRVSIAVIVGCSDPSSKDSTFTDCRIALGAVAPNPFRVRSAEKALVGCNFDPSKLDSCVEAAFQEISGTLGQRASAVYKKKAGPALVRRAITMAMEQVGK